MYKISVKSMFLLNNCNIGKLISRQSFQVIQGFSFHHTVVLLIQYHTLWKFRNFTATIFLQKFRQINVLLKNFTIN